MPLKDFHGLLKRVLEQMLYRKHSVLAAYVKPQVVSLDVDYLHDTYFEELFLTHCSTVILRIPKCTTK